MAEPLSAKDKATASRWAAGLFRHWLRDDVDGVLALLDEVEDADGLDPTTSLICSLLNIGENLIIAARDGREIAYLEYVLAAASLDEVKETGHA